MREECQSKYGEVNKVVVVEVPNTLEVDAVRILVEFKRIESAIKGNFEIFLWESTFNFYSNYKNCLCRFKYEILLFNIKKL